MWPTKQGTDIGNPFEKRHWRSNHAIPSLPAITWYNFKSKAWSPARVSFTAYPADNFVFTTKSMPSKFAFLGSNDRSCNENSPWVRLCKELFKKPVSSFNETRSCDVDRAKIRNRKFRCLALRIIATHNTNTVRFSNLRIWVF